MKARKKNLCVKYLLLVFPFRYRRFQRSNSVTAAVQVSSTAAVLLSSDSAQIIPSSKCFPSLFYVNWWAKDWKGDFYTSSVEHLGTELECHIHSIPLMYNHLKLRIIFVLVRINLYLQSESSFTVSAMLHQHVSTVAQNGQTTNKKSPTLQNVLSLFCIFEGNWDEECYDPAR